MKSKWFLFLSVAIINLALSILPEFISDKMKGKVENILGSNYDTIWLAVFLFLALLFIFLSWRQYKSEGNNNSKRGTTTITNSKNVVVGDIKAKGNITVGDQINQFGLKPREVSNSLIVEIQNYAPNKNTPIGVARRSQDSESYEYATKIVNALIAAGYKNAFVNGIVHDQIIGGDPNVAAKHQREIGFKMEEGQLNIALPSNQ